MEENVFALRILMGYTEQNRDMEIEKVCYNEKYVPKVEKGNPWIRLLTRGPEEEIGKDFSMKRIEQANDFRMRIYPLLRSY
jgi:hypothetical protein